MYNLASTRLLPTASCAILSQGPSDRSGDIDNWSKTNCERANWTPTTTISTNGAIPDEL